MCKIIQLVVKEELVGKTYWDHEFIRYLFEDIPDSDRIVVVIPGPYQADSYDKLNEELSKYEKVLVIITSDEECKFDHSKLEHKDMIIYSQYGNGGRMFPLGFAPGTRERLMELGLQDKRGWFFSGQITHYRRKLMAEFLKNRNDGYFIPTDGFAKGVGRSEYVEYLARAKAAPCSPGPVSVESFRIYEALEAGCVPVVDEMNPLSSQPNHYYHYLFGQPPFPIFSNFEEFSDLMKECLENKDLNNFVYAWWINYKFGFKQQLRHDLGLPDDEIAVIIPVSPIPSHPDTRIIDETIRTIRVHTDAPILVTIDGVREEHKHMKDDYREFIRRFLWRCNFEYKDVLPILFNKHSHQSGMMKAILPSIGVPLILYVESDTPLTPDREIPLKELGEVIKAGKADVIRFHFESIIPEPHKHLMIGEPENNLQKTTQWSQRPHLASTEYYRNIMDQCFSKESCTFIEDKMHSVCQVNPWEMNKLFIYHPEGDIKRSYNLDGREGGPKYDENLVF